MLVKDLKKLIEERLSDLEVVNTQSVMLAFTDEALDRFEELGLYPMWNGFALIKGEHVFESLIEFDFTDGCRAKFYLCENEDITVDDYVNSILSLDFTPSNEDVRRQSIELMKKYL